MIALMLAVFSSTMVSVMIRLGSAGQGSRMGQLLSNYTVCTLLGLFFTLRGGISMGDRLGFACGLGIFGGFLFLYSLVTFQRSVEKNGVVLSSTFMKLGVLVPTLLAMLVFRERPDVPQLLGLALATAAIVTLNFERGQSAAGKGLLILLLLVCGGSDALTNVYDKLGAAEYRNLFLLVIFFTALICTAGALLRNREKPSGYDLLCGIGVGVPNYFSSRFLLASLKTVPAVVVFPVYSIATILLITAAGLVFFRESLNRRKTAALLMILAALVLLNL